MELPAGLESLFLTGNTQAAHKVRTGEDLTEAVPYALVSKAAVLEEVQFKGQISDLYALKDKLKKYAPDEVLFVWDVEEVYGNNFLIAVTEAARDAQLESFRSAEAAASAAAPAEADGGAAAAAEEEEVYVQVASRPWESLGSEKEVEAAAVRDTRPPLQLAMSRARREFGQPCKLSDRDAHDGAIECKPFKDPNYELRRSVRSSGAQSAPQHSDGRSQTEWFRPLNRSTQAEPQRMGAAELAAALRAPALGRFLGRSRTLLEGALQQNELSDIYADELRGLAEEDEGKGGKSQEVRELQSFSRSSYAAHNLVTASRWRPGGAGVIGVSLARKAPFEERADAAGRVHTAHVLMWSFADPITPQCALQAESDILTFAFCPAAPNLVLGGCADGQLRLWDLGVKPPPLLGAGALEGGGAAAAVGGEGGEGEGGGGQTVHLPPCASSALEHGHRRGVTAIAWLPARHEATPGGRLVCEDGGSGSNGGGGPKGSQGWQCATMACDGLLCFWDVRSARKETAADAGKAGEREKRREPEDRAAWEAVEAAAKRGEALLWVPICRLVLHKLDGSNELPCKLLDLAPIQHGGRMHAATEDGELAVVQLPHLQTPVAGAEPEAVELSVKAVLGAHASEALSLQRSPFFKDVHLTVGDWTCHVWKEGLSAPLFSSPCAPERLTAGCWSPTRAAVLFLARADGSVDVWDLADRTHEPSLNFSVVGGGAVTSLDIYSQPPTQLLAAGDDQGTLHVLELPRNLRRPHGAEKAAMAAFIEREELRVGYTRERAERRAAPAEENPEAGAADSAAAVALPALAADGAADAGEEEFDEKAEEAYRALEVAFRAELGLTNGSAE